MVSTWKDSTDSEKVGQLTTAFTVEINYTTLEDMTGKVFNDFKYYFFYWNILLSCF